MCSTEWFRVRGAGLNEVRFQGVGARLVSVVLVRVRAAFCQPRKGVLVSPFDVRDRGTTKRRWWASGEWCSFVCEVNRLSASARGLAVGGCLSGPLVRLVRRPRLVLPCGSRTQRVGRSSAACVRARRPPVPHVCSVMPTVGRVMVRLHLVVQQSRGFILVTPFATLPCSEWLVVCLCPGTSSAMSVRDESGAPEDTGHPIGSPWISTRSPGLPKQKPTPSTTRGGHSLPSSTGGTKWSTASSPQ